MRILVIGGTQFVGRAIVEVALGRGHDVTLVHRGRTGADLFPDADHRLADRNGDLSVLAEGAWDATIDVSAYLPGQVHRLADALDGRGGHHVLISTVSVYADPDGPGADETSPTVEAAGDDVTAVTNETYGALKVAVEHAAVERHGDGTTIVRPTMVIGPHDHTGRFTWWVDRLAEGGEVLVPGPAEQPIQVVDARDMAEWIVALTENATPGTFDAVQPPTALFELFARTADALGSDAELRVVDADRLATAGITPADIPFWTGGERAWVFALRGERAVAAGLAHRPFADTIRDIHQWMSEAGPASVLKPSVGLDRGRERELLAEIDGQ